jgi:hypothetical protein
MRPYRPSATPRARALLRSLDREHQTAAGAELKTATAPGLDDDVRIDVDIDPDSAPAVEHEVDVVLALAVAAGVNDRPPAHRLHRRDRWEANSLEEQRSPARCAPSPREALALPLGRRP